MLPDLRILITDDDPVILYIHRRAIEKCGLPDITCFLNGRDTLDHITLQGPDINYLIVLDINMPGISGWDLLDEITEKNHNNIHVIVVSSSVNTGDHEKAKTYSQIIGFIEKPLSDVKMITLMESHSYKTAWPDNINGDGVS